jgi:uncharacterized protein (TIGR00270 family)
MPECEVCGKSIPCLRRASIDGVVFDVCDQCVDLGEEIKVIQLPQKTVVKKQEEMEILGEDESELVPDFPMTIRKEREKRGLNQKEVGSKIGVSESLIKRIEGGFRPTDDVIKKIEKFFGVKLIL